MHTSWPHFQAFALQPGIIFIDLAATALGNDIDRACNQNLQRFLTALAQREAPANSALAQLQTMLVELVGGYHQAHYYYDFMAAQSKQLTATAVAHLMQQAWQEFQQNPEQDSSAPDSSGQLHQVLVCYNERFGPELATIANELDASIKDVIQLHTAPEYYIYTIGFAPNFAYMGDVAEVLQRPRLASPRTKVPALSVAIAERQTAVYPLPSPGGWNLLGRAVGLPSWHAGDRVQFVAISEQDYQQQVRHGHNDAD